MRRARLWLVPMVALLAGSGPDERADDLVVHEWGTFLGMSGSDGVALDGMYHEEHALPAFVHARSRDQLRAQSILVKSETPVIYFYTPRTRNVRVEVTFPRGIWTQWYPHAAYVGPPLSGPAPADGPRHGRIIWRAEVVPPSIPVTPAPPETSADALWNFAREVDAASVRTAGAKGWEAERYLFYRGLGGASMPVRMSADAGGTLAAEAGSQGPVRHVFVLRVEGGKGAFAYRPMLEPGAEATAVIPAMDRALPLDRFVDAVADALAVRLVESGLYPKEARAMVNTWKESYFRTEGVRALFVLPQAWTDAFIPLSIAPRPKEVVRVMVGRIELLTPGRERLAERAVLDLVSPDSAKRREAFAYLREQGRYVEPIVRRVLAATTDAQVRAACKNLLLADFVTDLRASVRRTEKPLPNLMAWNDDPAYIRAQLAALLREVGREAEARVEGAAALEALKGRTPPPEDSCNAQAEHRAWARALEGVGDDRAAAGRYAKVIALGALAARTQDCRACHTNAGIGDDHWRRGWWAGERYAATLSRSGDLEAAIAGAERAPGPDRPAADLALRYLRPAPSAPVDAGR